MTQNMLHIFRDIVRNNDEDSRDSKPDTRSEAGADSKEDISERRVTRSQMRSQHGKKDNNGNSRDSATGLLFFQCLRDCKRGHKPLWPCGDLIHIPSAKYTTN